jgi:hypothetical protein
LCYPPAVYQNIDNIHRGRRSAAPMPIVPLQQVTTMFEIAQIFSANVGHAATVGMVMVGGKRTKNKRNLTKKNKKQKKTKKSKKYK